jgi:hypothetical protein
MLIQGPATWTDAAAMATVIGTVFGVVGLGAIYWQLRSQVNQTRLETFEAFVRDLDTHEARTARKRILEASEDQLRLEHLNSESAAELRKDVDNTLATLERKAYKIWTKQVPERDAYNYYGGVLLAMANKLWPYIEDHRAMRSANPMSHKLIYRRYFQYVAEMWLPRYCNELVVAVDPPPKGMKIQDKLHLIFPAQNKSPGEKDGPQASDSPKV